MNHFLVPTDFSPLSKVAAQYAIRLATATGGELTFLHVIPFIEPTRNAMRSRVSTLLRELVAAGTEDLQTFAQEALKATKSDLQPKLRVVAGQSFPLTIRQEAKRAKAAMVVMGTKGASGLKKIVVGSNTTSVIEASSIPVLVVPELGQFKTFRNIVLATSGHHVEKELKALKPLVTTFDAVVHLINIASSQAVALEMENRLEALVKKSGYTQVVIRVIVNRNVEKAIENYLTSVKADLLTTFPKNHDVYDRLFDRSITRKMAFQSKIPLLAYRLK